MREPVRSACGGIDPTGDGLIHVLGFFRLLRCMANENPDGTRHPRPPMTMAIRVSLALDSLGRA
jgi:hypothetical protein